MKRQDWINIIFTFFVGFFSGAYLYVGAFAPAVEELESAIEDTEEVFAITGEAYGGCERVGSCPSFRIDTDGTYRYAYLPRGASAQAIREGVLPLRQQRDLRRAATLAALREQSELVDPIMCESYADGIDTYYLVEIDDRQFELDSCGTAVEADSALWQELSALWAYFQASR